MLLLAFLFPAHACDAPTRTSDVLDAAGRAELAYIALDAAGFEDALANARVALGCLGDPLTVDGAAAYHRAEALGAFLAGDTIAAGESFEAVRAAHPGWRLPNTIAPEGHPLRLVFDAAVPGSETFALTAAPPVAWFQVDGTRRDAAPSDRPFVLQRFGTGGEVLSTAVTTEAQVAAEAAPEPVEPLPVEPMPEPARSPRAARWGLGIGAGVLALGSGAAFTVAALAHDRYWDPATPPDKLPGLQTTTNATTITGAALGAGALGCATGAVLAGRF